MLDKINELTAKVKEFKATSKEEVENFRIKYLGRKGILKDLFNDFKKIDSSSKKEIGKALNHLRNFIEEKIKNQVVDELEKFKHPKGGNLVIAYNTALENLEGMNNIEQIKGSLVIAHNPSLKSLNGLYNLRYIGGHLVIIYNEKLVDLKALDNLEHVEGKLIVSNNNPSLNI